MTAPTPGVMVVAKEYDPPSPHTEITITAPAGVATYTLTRVDDNSAERVIVRGTRGATIATTTVASDFENPLNRPFHYEAVFYSSAGAQVGAALSSASLSVGGAGACAGWLSAPGVPSLALQIEPVNDGTTTRPISMDVLYAMGRRRAIVVSGQRFDREQHWQFITRSTAETALLLDILYAANPVLLRLVYPAALADGGYLAISEVTEERYDDTDPLNPLRWFQFDTVVVDTPDEGYGLAFHNWAELKATAPTWSYVRAHWSNWVDVLRDPTTPTVP